MSSLPSSTLSSAIDNVFQRFPERTAIVCPVAGDLRFADLAEFSSSVSLQLAELGIGSGDRVVIFGRRSAAKIAALRAVLTVGAAYIPVAHSMPVERVSYIVGDCRPRCIICDEASEAVARPLAEESGLALIRVDPIDRRVDLLLGDGTTESPGDEAVNEDEPCYILYTSGSTGHPKGVVVTRANVDDYARWAIDYFNISEEDKILSTAPFYFDMSTFDIYAALASGATLIIASEKECLFPRLLVRKIEQYGVTVWKAVSSLFAHVAQIGNIDADKLGKLRVLVFSGERLPTHYLAKWMTALPTARYHNAYGPTEATGISTCHHIETIPEESDVVPIGQPCTNTQVFLVNNGKLVETNNEPGEVVIGGPGVAAGYWGDPEKSRNAFVYSIGDVTFDEVVYRTGDIGYRDDAGDIVFVARVDRQIKHQGYRIELDDIESELRRIQGVEDAAVVHLDTPSSSEIVGFYIGEDGADELEVRSSLGGRLPRYMVPKVIRKLDAIPRTDRGKTDYQALEELCR